MSEGIDLHVHLAPASGVDDRRGPAALHDPAALDAYLDRADLAEAIVSIPPPYFRQGLTAAETGVWAQRVNDGLLAAVTDHPRQTPLAYLPLDHPELAIQEYRRVRADPRFAGVCGAAGGRSASLADARFDPLWALLDADSRLVMLHPGTSPDERLEPFYLSNLLGNPVETAVAAAQLVFGGVLSRHPALRILLVHCGGAVTAVAGRWDRGIATNRPGLHPLPETPGRSLRRFYVDCLAHDPGQVDRAAEVFGPERVVLGSDWPFAMGTDDPRSLVAHRGAAYVDAVATVHADHALGRRPPLAPRTSAASIG
jgi:aminocarboxymuconate-semialdehyde decarboxylase